ncbi:MAG: purine-nucleoside phosphorylase [Clostridia bacterium]|nr:purine-nucleoside phosphorylase [Clostridia bacterium]
MNKTPTPHNSAKLGEIAKTVLMPGDPLRSKMIAEKYLENAKLVNNVRGVQGYTGTYKGVPVTVMAHGMGPASVGIYTYELFAFYNVENIIRIGSIGALREEIKLQSVIIGEKSFTNTNYDDFYMKHGETFVDGSKKLATLAKKIAKKKKINTYAGTIMCSDTFYTDRDSVALAKEHDLLGVEMESAALYINADKFNKQAITLCTVSDNIVTGEALNSEDRQNTFFNMIEIALNMAVELN